ncbi:MAG: ABC transporter permease [Rhodococcus sp. (in: high G+C Gram-positive bacteria)]
MSRLEIRSRLRWADNLSEAFSAIAQRPARTLLTALGTILGVGAFVATTGLADTARAQVSARFDALKATEVRIQDANPDGTNPFPDDPDQTLEALNGINHAGLIYTITDNGTLQPRTSPTRPLDNSQPIPLIAATPGAIAAALPTLTTGTLYNQFHQSRAERVAVIGRVAADQLGITRIDNQPAVFVGDIAYTVIGILDDVDRNPDLLLSIIIPTSTEHHDIATQGAAYEVLIDTDPGAAQLAGRQAPTALRPQDPQRLQALVPPDPQTLRNNVQSDVTSLYYALAGLALFIGTVAIANATLLNTIERRPEIGLRRALGAKRSHITRQITLEAAITGTIAGACGTALAIIAVTLTAHTRGWTATINPTVTIIAPLIGLATGAIAGLAPALKAAQTPPATTLRT